VRQIAVDLASTFDAGLDDVRSDVAAFLSDFVEKRVIDL
jgi:hypothetical protein